MFIEGYSRLSLCFETISVLTRTIRIQYLSRLCESVETLLRS